MEHKDTLNKKFLTHTNDDLSDDEVSSNPLDANATDDTRNAPTSPVTHSRNKLGNLIAKGFVIMSHGINRFIKSWKNIFSWFGRS